MGVKLTTRQLWSAAISVALLAVVIIAFAAFNAPEQTADRPANQALLELGGGAPAALPTTGAPGATATSAVGSAATSLTSNSPAGQDAAGSGSGEQTPPSGDSAAPVDPAFLKRFDDLAVLMPTAFENFDLSAVSQVKRNVTVSGSPQFKGSPASRIIWAVNDAGTAAKAAKSLRRTSKVLYDEDASKVSIRGVPGYFGTDGTQFATIAFTRGRYRFEVLVTANGIDPKKLRDIAAKAAAAFPAAPRGN